MQQTDVVFRSLADEAMDGRRSWPNVSELARQASVGDKLAYKAVGRLASIGAITKQAGGGFSVTDPERIALLLASRRSLNGARKTTFDVAQDLLRTLQMYAIGGTRAAQHHLGGQNTIADHAPAIIYVPDNTGLHSLPPGNEALVLTADRRTLNVWADGYTSRAQTYADLFAQPGWQASEFRRALWRAWFAVDDWSTTEVGHG